LIYELELINQKLKAYYQINWFKFLTLSILYV
jgi:hypothetical protein